ncbi:hypothetical protein AMES_5621 [Amycolatopsis mediterranei S699]|uniref:Secreted protein n=1 Tax=Amycolatopsis mediterranei (strain U-32) TaxID=749927 RepID=A0A0H3D9X3_AMYMU|nr:hypothetical protein [Amycolatopsis mediterranei]ADJ47446.1 hypothetical protein AMED_5695 [Amycolatopsis mediterranei U32]AFO79157.1 hypothetical protein AMES_5621 [Amycolatopsis mediterranei S699]AGT86285.1 hypothetical protein B737_5621 [Amycolatopsis mediterranei RB]KDO12630.1 hypothetical protein DV26_01545 [Amycolatopsis mediterranei]KDU88714.1 hypothetical protein DV36_29340 [Amycolatopsis mediterranei]
MPGALVLAGAASGICWTVAPASAGAATNSVPAGCTTSRTSDGKWIGVSCDVGRYYVYGSACNERACTSVGGPVVSAPATSWAYAGSGYFNGPIRAIFV